MTAFTRALYYPWIDIDNEGWLKNAILYWDQIQTIVPQSIKQPYSMRTARDFQDSGLLEPLFVESSVDEVEELTSDVLTYINSPEGADILTSDNYSKYRHIHPSKFSERVQRLLRLHPEKLSHEIKHIIRHSLSDDEWFHVDERFGNFYMTLLATRLSERRGLGLLTDTPTSDRLSNAAKLDAGFTLLDLHPRRRMFGFDGYSEGILRHKQPSTLAQGALANLVINRIQIDPETPARKIIQFKKDYSDELGLFRSKVADLTSAISAEQPFESLMQRVNDIYTNEFKPELSTFKKILKASKIKWAAENFFKVSFFSTSATSVPLALIGLTIPQALLVGVGISLTVSAVLYNCDKTDKLNQSPFTYILAAEKNLG
jgi:hypothetical protein